MMESCVCSVLVARTLLLNELYTDVAVSVLALLAMWCSVRPRSALQLTFAATSKPEASATVAVAAVLSWSPRSST
jgi:hypothetical protein